MGCRVCFKILTYNLDDEAYNRLVDHFPVEPGMTEQALYFGLMKRDTDEENFSLSVLLHECLSTVYEMKDLLKLLQPEFGVRYVLDVRFSDIEEEMEKGTSFTVDEEVMNFLHEINAEFNLNDGYFDSQA